MDNKKLFESARPKIGIRVIVDGRYNGVREKIEGPTFALAERPEPCWRKTCSTRTDSPWNVSSVLQA